MMDEAPTSILLDGRRSSHLP